MKRVREWLLVGAGALLLVALACSGSDSTGPSAAPPLGTIAFVSARDGNQEIYVMNADGSGVSRLTNTPATDIDPAWSPDGRRIAFASDGDRTHRIYDIYVMNADGSGVTRLTNDPVTAWGPAWSPDGTKIAFESYRDGNGEIYVMNPDGSAVTNLTHDPADDAWPAWSPDGAKIAFSCRVGPTLSRDIYVMNADGTGVKNLTNNPADDYTPAWSPDGSRIAFASDRDEYYGEIYVMNADGSGVTRLTIHPLEDLTPAWSPDGSKIAFARENESYKDEIYVMSPDGSGVTRLSDSGREPAWKPQGVLEAGMKARQPGGVTGHSETPMPAPCRRQRAPRRRYESKPTVAAHYRRRAARLSRGLH